MSKLTKPEVHYRVATTPRQCGNCSMFRPRKPHAEDGACTLVAGGIEARKVCDKWEPDLADS